MGRQVTLALSIKILTSVRKVIMCFFLVSFYSLFFALSLCLHFDRIIEHFSEKKSTKKTFLPFLMRMRSEQTNQTK